MWVRYLVAFTKDVGQRLDVVGDIRDGITLTTTRGNGKIHKHVNHHLGCLCVLSLLLNGLTNDK